MNIAIDGRGAILYRGTGIGTYTWQLIDHLTQKACTPRIFWPGEEYRDFRTSQPDALALVEGGDNYRRHVWLPRQLQAEHIDLFHVPQNGIGLPEKKCCLQTVTIHDLIPYLYPETVGRGYLKEFLREMPRILDQSDGVIAVSDCTKRDLLRVFDYPAERIQVIHEAPEPLYRPLSQAEREPVLREKYHIRAPYIFYAGGFGQRKNVKALINAFYLLCREDDLPHKLVLAGRLHRELDQSEALADALGLGNRVIFCGYVPVAEMPALYSGADLFVYPSFYEGFGLPPLEAMACGCPVVAANTSSLPEVLGKAARYCDPADTLALAAAMRAVLADEQLGQRCRQLGLEKAASYSWKQTAAQTMAFWQKTGRGGLYNSAEI